MYRIFILILTIVGYSLNLFSQVKIPKCYNDYEFNSNVDSLEKYVYAHKDNPLVYLHGLINLELSRGIYKEVFGQDLTTIKTIAAEQNDELGKVLGLLLETSLNDSKMEKSKILENKYFAADYFIKAKDTLGVVLMASSIIRNSQNVSDDTWFGNKKTVDSWYETLEVWGKNCSQPRTKLIFYTASIQKSKILEDILSGVALALDIFNKNPKLDYYKTEFYFSLLYSLSYQSDFDRMLKYSLLSYQSAKSLNNEYKASASFNLAIAYINKGKYVEAEKYYKESYMFLKEMKNRNHLLMLSTVIGLSYVQYKQKKYKIAYENKLLADSLEVILNEKNKLDNILELETKYEVEKKEAQNTLLLTEKKNLETRNLLSSLLILCTLGFLVFLWKINLNLKKNREALSESKLKLEENANFRERLFGIIAHDIRSPLSAYSDLSQTCAYLIKHKRWDSLETISNQLDKVSYGLNTLLDNLLFWLKSRQDITEVSMTTIPVQNALNDIIQLYQEVAQVRDIRLELAISSIEELNIMCEAQAFQLIIRNLVDNAIKNTDKGELVKVQISEIGERAIISVLNKPKIKNNSIIQNIQNLFASSSSIGIDKKGLGLGLILTKEFTIANNATIELIENPDETLCFQVIFPKKN